MNPKVKKIALYLRDVRKYRGISQKEFSANSGLNIEVINAIETGDFNYTIDDFFAYISAVDCYFYLADREGKHLDREHLVNQVDNSI